MDRRRGFQTVFFFFMSINEPYCNSCWTILRNIPVFCFFCPCDSSLLITTCLRPAGQTLLLLHCVLLLCKPYPLKEHSAKNSPSLLCGTICYGHIKWHSPFFGKVVSWQRFSLQGFVQQLCRKMKHLQWSWSFYTFRSIQKGTRRQRYPKNTLCRSRFYGLMLKIYKLAVEEMYGLQDSQNKLQAVNKCFKFICMLESNIPDWIWLSGRQLCDVKTGSCCPS